MKAKKKKDCRPTCCECGSTNVETTAWVEYREDGSERVVNSEGPFGNEEGNWCHDCDAHVELHYPTTTPRQDWDRYQNNAAREHGPALLDALIELLPLAHHRLLDRFKVSVCGEDTGATLESDGLPAGWRQAANYRKAVQLVALLTRGKEG